MTNQQLVKDFTEKAAALLLSDSTAEQVIFLRTASGGEYHCLNHNIISGDGSEEEAFGRMLKENRDTQVDFLICMWRDGTIDLPSMHLRRLLLEIDPRNAETRILLNGGAGLHTRAISAVMP